MFLDHKNATMNLVMISIGGIKASGLSTSRSATLRKGYQKKRLISSAKRWRTAAVDYAGHALTQPAACRTRMTR